MYSPLLFTTSFHLSTNLSMLFHQKSPSLVSKNLLSQFLRSSSLSKITPHVWFDKDSNSGVQGPENTADAEGLPFEPLECGFDDLCNIKPGAVVKKYGLALSMDFFSRIASFMRCSWATYTSLLTIAFLSSISQCTMPSQSHQMPIMVFLGWRSGLTLGFGISPGATHSFLCFIFTYRHHFSSPVTIRYKKHCL